MSNKFELDYKNLLLTVLQYGEQCKNRTKIDTIKLFNKSLNVNLSKGFPILTGKKIFFNKALAEFKWIYEGRTDLEYLKNNNVNWWDDFAINNSLGKVYGYQIKKYNNKVNQVEYCINEIKNNTRRAVITLLNLTIHFRSSDLFLGLPYDIIVGALFLITIAKECNLMPDVLGLNLADAHIYLNHIDAVNSYIDNNIFNLPKLKGDYNNYYLDNYKSNSYIKAELIK